MQFSGSSEGQLLYMLRGFHRLWWTRVSHEELDCQLMIRRF